MLIQTSTSIAEIEFDPTAVEVVTANLKKGGEGRRGNVATLQPFFYSVGFSQLSERNRTKPLYHSLA